MAAQTNGLGEREFFLVSRLAGFLSRPTAYCHSSHLDGLEPGPETISALARRAAFLKPLEAAVVDRLELESIEFDEHLLQRIISESAVRLAIMITAAESEELTAAASILSAAILYPELSVLLKKSDRERAIARLGDVPFQVARQEAAGLYPELAKLRTKQTPIFTEDASEDHEGGLEPALVPGLSCLHSLARSAGGAFERLFFYRVPKEFKPSLDERELDQRCRTQIIKLLSRKMEGWSQCIV